MHAPPESRTAARPGGADLAYGAFQRGFYLTAFESRSSAPRQATFRRRPCSG